MPIIGPAHVKARVVDIRQAHPFPARIAVDAQVLYFVYYPNFHFFSMSGINVPTQFSHGLYAMYLEDLKKYSFPPKEPGDPPSKVSVCTSGHTIGEFARTMEYAEVEILWRTDPTNAGSNFDARRCKDARYTYAANLTAIRTKVETIIVAVRKLIDVLPKSSSESQDLNDCIQAWKASLGDYADSLLISRMKYMSIYDVLSDDMDMVTFDGITLYTANPTAINAARRAGKCVN
jgi:hypothetical protein